MDNLKVLESEDHKLTEKMEDSKMEKNNDIFRNYLSTFTPSAQTCDLPDVNPSMSDSEEVQKSRYWMDKDSLVVDDSEELVSNVISIECYDYEKLLFPINIAIPFISCFRGNYREIMVKVTDTNFQSNYLTPISFQRYQGNHKESFAEVKIYHLGVFSVLSCLKKETFTVPKNYFNVIFSVIIWLSRAVSTSVRRSGDNLSETLKLLGHGNKKEGWKVFDDVIIQNAQNGLVYFEINEHLESFVVIRLAFPLENRYLLLFAQALEEALRSTMANVILYQKREDPYKIVVLLSASRELTNELQNLHEEGYFGPPEPTQQFPLRQGEQIHFIFRGNIYASENGEDFRKVYRLIFHSQRQPRLEHQIKEVDEFGNHSSPHYKGTAVFYKITKEMIPKKWEQTLPYDEYQHQYPLCKLALTLPKHEKLIHHPRSTKRIFSDSSEALWDKLLFWLAEELAEDNTSLFALCLPVRRSVLQLVSLKCPDNLTHQIYELLCCWNKTLPKSADKQQLLSRYLQKSGRSDLSEELRLKWQNKVFT
ncbi:Death domain-containing protein 1 [Lonchura striata]|uniref:Death domain-containing protein 1 n=1 Tax=Lonchura striata TaxID=40157 RepID=A0A218UM56_9PASE|nr:Death domain-containing protein 1 [Lonchura striata domestica]